jgi:hypothetical protein
MKAGSRLTAHGAAKGRAIAATFAAFMFVATIFATSAQAQTYSVVYNFAGGTGDGEGPYGSLTQDSAGNIYGVTLRGGALIHPLEPRHCCIPSPMETTGRYLWTVFS